jgi:hypothetical protein
MGTAAQLGYLGLEVDDRNWQTKVYPGASDWGHRPVAPT